MGYDYGSLILTYKECLDFKNISQEVICALEKLLFWAENREQKPEFSDKLNIELSNICDLGREKVWLEKNIEFWKEHLIYYRKTYSSEKNRNLLENEIIFSMIRSEEVRIMGIIKKNKIDLEKYKDL